MTEQERYEALLGKIEKFGTVRASEFSSEETWLKLAKVNNALRAVVELADTQRKIMSQGIAPEIEYFEGMSTAFNYVIQAIQEELA